MSLYRIPNLLLLIGAAACAAVPNNEPAQSSADATARDSSGRAAAPSPRPADSTGPTQARSTAPGIVRLASEDQRDDGLSERVPSDWKARSISQIPLVAGLTEIVDVHEPRGDYESMSRLESARPEGVTFAFSLRSGSVSGVRSIRARRTVSSHDLAEARNYKMTFSNSDPDSFPGMTATGVSSAVLEELQRTGKSEIGLTAGVDLVGALLATAGGSPEMTGELIRAEDKPVGFAVLVNGRRVWLPALHAIGNFKSMVRAVKTEFWFLADARNPMTLRAIVGPQRLQVVRIDFPTEGTTSTLEKALADRQPVEMWGVYFETGSAELRPESAMVLDTVAAVLRRHPDWRLRIEGHTDDVGREGDNLRLSQQRARAVREELSRRLATDASRLESAGYGATRPRESNATLAGRARNRRVELVRQ